MHPLQPDTVYHIFNHANGFENVFCEAENYRYFMEKYRLYINPIAETYAWCLMPNHFHFVIRIRKRNTIEELIFNSKSNTSNDSIIPKVSNFGNDERDKRDKQDKPDKTAINDSDIEKYLSKQFANFFSCYTQSFNKMYKRMGSLFIKNFKRQPIENKQHFLNTVIYTHRNPIHHGFCNGFNEWSYSSYFDFVNGDDSLVQVEKLLKMFGGLESFKEQHLANLIGFRKLDDIE